MPKFQLERSIAIKAPAASVFSNVVDFRNWAIWSPWILAEPQCSLSYAEDGKSYSWSGDVIGAGEMEVLNSVVNKEIHYRLTFLKPFKSTSSVSFYFDEGSGETNTRWTMSGALPFFLFWMKKSMVAGIGMDYDRGLRMLKDHVELGKIPSELKYAGLELVEAFDYIGLSRDCQLADISKVMPDDMQKLCSAVSESGIRVTGPAACFYNKFDMTSGSTRYTIGLPVKAGTACPKGFVSGSQPRLRCYAIHHAGPYRHLGNPWAAGMMHQRAGMFAQDKKCVPFEIYQNDPRDIAEEDVQTSVYFPIR